LFIFLGLTSSQLVSLPQNPTLLHGGQPLFLVEEVPAKISVVVEDMAESRLKI